MKKLFNIMLISTLCLSFPIVSSATTETEVSVTIEKGLLELAVPVSTTFDNSGIIKLIGGKNQRFNGVFSDKVTIQDGRGTGEGWRLQAIAEPLTAPDGSVIPSSEIAIKGVSSISALDDTIGVSGINALVSTTTRIDTPEPVSIVNANLNSGMGSYGVTLSGIEVLIPGNQKLFTSVETTKSITSTITWTLVTGP